MATLAERGALTAQRLIEKHGRFVNFVKDARTAADPAKPWRGAGAAVPKTIKNVKAVEDHFSFREIDGDTVKRGDKKFLVAALSLPDGTVLEEYDRLTDGDDGDWSIENILPLQPGETRVMYTLHVRR